MTTEPFPLEHLTGWDQAALLGSYCLDQCNPNIWPGVTAEFPDCAVIGAAFTLGYAHCDYPLTGTTTATPYTVHFAGGGSSPYSFFGTDSLKIHSPTELQTFAFASFNNLKGFELIDWSGKEASYSNSTLEWFLPYGMSFTTTTTYTTMTLLETNATIWNLEVAICSCDQPICKYSQTGSVLYESCCKLEPWGRLTARALIRDCEAKRRSLDRTRNRGKRGPVLHYDPKRDARLSAAQESCGGRTYAERVQLLQRTFPSLTENELRDAVDRHRHRQRR